MKLVRYMDMISFKLAIRSGTFTLFLVTHSSTRAHTERHTH